MVERRCPRCSWLRSAATGSSALFVDRQNCDVDRSCIVARYQSAKRPMRRRQFITLRCCHLAPPSACAATGDAGGRISAHRNGRLVLAHAVRVPRGPGRGRLRRGQNVAIEYRWANNQGERRQDWPPTVSRHVSVIVAAGERGRRLRPRRPPRLFPSFWRSVPIRCASASLLASVALAATSRE